MTGEKDFRLSLGINSDILWKTQYDNNLHKIPKIFLFDAASFPASFENPNNSEFFESWHRQSCRKEWPF